MARSQSDQAAKDKATIERLSTEVERLKSQLEMTALKIRVLETTAKPANFQSLELTKRPQQ